jgi:hypothetical protein
MKTTCPHCSKTHDIPDQYADKKIKCPSCAEGFVVTKDKDIIVNQNPGLASRNDSPLSEPRNFSIWYIAGLLAIIGIPFLFGGSVLGLTYGLGLLFLCIAVGNILHELRVIAHHLRERP